MDIDYDIDSYLGDFAGDLTDDQREALRDALPAITARYPSDDDQMEDRQAALNAAVQVIVGDTAQAAVGAAYQQARRVEREAMAALTGATIAGATLGVSESESARLGGVTRMTIRAMLGK